MATYPASDYPGAADTDIPTVSSGDNLNTVGKEHADLHNALRNSILAIQGELGNDPSGSYATVLARLDASVIAYSSYSPTLAATTTNPTLGTGGSVSGRYFQTGRHVVGDVVVQFGTSGVSNGSGAYTVTLPVTCSTTLPYAVLGSAYMYDNGAGLRTAVATRNSSTKAQFIMDGAAGGLAATVPWTWAANYLLVIHFAYESAS